MRVHFPIIFSTFLTSIAVAQSADESLVASGQTQSNAWLAGDAGMGSFGDDGMATIHAIGFGESGQWRALVEARLRLRLLDSAPEESTIREEDWDEPSDFAHVLRELSFTGAMGEKGYLELRVGEQQDVTIGHGTIVRDYTNAIDPDHLRAGVWMRLDDPWFSVEALIDSFVGPRLMAGRLSGHPLDQRVTVGTTTAFDLYSPVTIRENVDGTRSLDGARNLEHFYSTLTMLGADAEMRIEQGKVVVTPYIDGNWHLGLGSGLHMGGVVELYPAAAEITLRGEYRFSSDEYVPAYADTLYDLTRLQFALATPTDEPATQRTTANNGGFGGHGFLTEASVDFRKIRLGASYSQRPGSEGNLLGLRADIPTWKSVVASARYIHRAIGQTSGAEGAVISGGLRVKLKHGLYTTADYSRLFRLADEGVYEPIHIASVGIGAMLGL